MREDVKMPIVGDKNIFAIEWEIFDYCDRQQWTDAYFRYWGNSIPIGVWEDFPKFEATLSYTKDFLKEENLRPNWDFSFYEKEDVFQCLHGCAFHAEVAEEFTDFYTFCREKMIQCYTLENQYLKSKHKFKIERYLREYPLMRKDFSLSSWVKHHFSIEHLGGESLDNHLYLYFVRDSQKNRERLIWRYHEEIDQPVKNEIFEAIMPIGYFEQIANEFLIQGHWDIENFQKNHSYGCS
jgi:hypothetical protein